MPVQILCKMDKDAAVEHNHFILLVVADCALVQIQRLNMFILRMLWHARTPIFNA